MAANLFTGYIIGFLLLGILFFGLWMILSVQTPEKIDLVLDMGSQKEKKE